MSSSLLSLATTAATLSYLTARFNLPTDYRILTSVASSLLRQTRLEKKDRINAFYSLEEWALSPHTADRPFLIIPSSSSDTGQLKQFTFRQTYDLVLRYAGWLHSNCSVRAKEIVALDFVNSERFMFLWLGLWSLGAVPAFINYNLSGSVLVHSVRVSTARLLIVDPEVSGVITPEVEGELERKKDGAGVKVIHFTPTLTSSLSYYPPFRAPDPSRSHTRLRDPAILIYTSGTTGLPKPAISSWLKIQTGAGFVARWLGLRPSTHKQPDRFYCCMPLYHSSGAVLGFANCLLNGTTFILGRRFSTSKFWPEVRETGATVIQYVGETCRYLLSLPPETNPEDKSKNLDQAHAVRIAFGNGLRPDVWTRFRDRFGIEHIAEFYAATEGTSGAWNFSSNDFAAGAVGQTGALAELLLSRQVCIVQVDYESEMPFREAGTGLCKRVARGETGELLYALDPADIGERFQGYFNNPAASEGKVVRDVLKRGDAWFRTGDLMRWDSEGRWWFVDRIGDTYRWKSENVSTAEVAAVLGLWPGVGGVGVEEANVYGVEVPGYEGRAGCAAVSLSGSGASSERWTEERKSEVMKFFALYLSNSLPKYSIPVFIRLINPSNSERYRTGTLKQQKHVLRRQGVDLDMVEGTCGDEIWWFKSDGGEEGPSYVRFTREDYHKLLAGKAKL